MGYVLNTRMAALCRLVGHSFSDSAFIEWDDGTSAPVCRRHCNYHGERKDRRVPVSQVVLSKHPDGAGDVYMIVEEP